jgi:uncharacterized protein
MMDFYLLIVSFAGLGILAGLLAGLFGIGGGIIIIPGLVHLFKTYGLIGSDNIMHVALGTSLASVVFTSMIALLVHSKQKMVRWPIVWQLVPGLLLGALLGSYLGSQLNTRWLTLIFAGFLALIALRFLFNWHSKVTYLLPRPIIMSCIGALTGTMTSMVGLGGGVLLIPILSLFPLTLREVTALSIVCIFPVALIAMFGYIIFGLSAIGLPYGSTGYVYWPAVLPIIIASSLCAPIGIYLAKRIETENLKRFFGVCLLVTSISLL